jgi:hypothetical protein
MRTQLPLTMLFGIGCTLALAEVAAMIKFLINVHGFSLSVVIWSLSLLASVYARFVIGKSSLLFQRKWNRKLWLFEIFRLPVYGLYIVCAYHAINGRNVCNEAWFISAMMIIQIVYLMAVSTMIEHIKVDLEEEGK